MSCLERVELDVVAGSAELAIAKAKAEYKRLAPSARIKTLVSCRPYSDGISYLVVFAVQVAS